MASGGLPAQPLTSQGGFNWVFQVEILLCGFLTVFFLFYFNRLFATVISYAIRAYTWRKYRVHIDINSLQISLLGGRLFFKSIRYHGHNETIFVHDGRITWRYWLRRVQEAAVFDESKEASRPPDDSGSEKPDQVDKTLDDTETGNIKPQPTLPCRFHVRVSGVEAFLYNHSPAYDGILAGVEARNEEGCHTTQSNDSASPPSPAATATSMGDLNGAGVEVQKTESSSYTIARSAGYSQSEPPSYLRLFPIQVECKKAAAAVGNENTPSIVVAKVESASGRIDGGRSGLLDLFKLMFLFDLVNVNVALKPNRDFKELQLQAAKRMEEEAASGLDLSHRQNPLASATRLLKSKCISIMTFLRLGKAKSGGSIRTASSSALAEEKQDLPDEQQKAEGWHGLARFLVDEESDRWEAIEYARFSSLAEMQRVKMRFFWDIPGIVSQSSRNEKSDAPEMDDPNGCAPPEYGMDLALYSGTVNYGPWADRQRVILQNVFFPASFVSSKPQKSLHQGETRLATVFKIHVCLEEDVTVRIPTREPSKDWKWQDTTAGYEQPEKAQRGPRKRRRRHSVRQTKKRNRRQGVTGADTRPFGWFDVTVRRNTVVNYKMDMYARKHGFQNKLDVDVKGTEITSSVNHGLLLRTGSLTLQGDLSNPLEWNALRNWSFDVLCHDLDFYILRDHMFLLTDLISDWSLGPAPSFFTFVPFRYTLALDFRHFSLFLNSNDANLVNNPADLDDNSFLILRGESLHGELTIPIDRYRPSLNEILFDVVARNLALDLHTPPRNTLYELLQSKRIAQLPSLTLRGSHSYFTEQSNELTDTLQMEICGTELSLQLYGFLVRHFINVKENYFGDFLHFKTLEEFQTSEGNAISNVAEEVEKYRYRATNELDVILTIMVDRPTIMLPTNLYSADNYIRAELPMVDVDLRVASYYLDLQTNISPLSITHLERGPAGNATLSGEQIHVNGAELSGHRLFGLPPTEPAYVSTWDVSVGSVMGESSSAFLRQVIKAGRAFAFAFDDLENAVPIADTLPVHDMTFVHMRTKDINLGINVGDAVMRVACDPIDLENDDFYSDFFSSRLSVRIPNITLSCAETKTAQRHRSRAATAASDRCIMFLQTTIDLTVIQRQKNFSDQRVKQQNHLRYNDRRAHRATFLTDSRVTEDDFAQDSLHAAAAAMYVPRLASPLRKSGTDVTIGQHGRHETDRKTLDAKAECLPNLVFKTRGSDRFRGTATITSAYVLPNVHPAVSALDLEDVPDFNATEDDESEDDDDPLEDQLTGLDLDRGLPQTSVIVRFEPGLRALFRPQMVDVAFVIASAVTSDQPNDIFDAFQIDAMDKVKSEVDHNTGHGQTTDIRMILPSVDLRLLMDPEAVSASSTETTTQQIDLCVGYCSLTVRVRTPATTLNAQPELIVHSTVGDVSLELNSRMEAESREIGGMRFELEDILLWLAFAKTRTVNLSFKVLTATMSAQQADFLAPVIVRLFALSSSAMQQATSFARIRDGNLRNLVRFIGGNHDQASDPPYLSRMTYVLRAFPNHFRNQDSWKIVARLRHAFELLSQTQSTRLRKETLDRSGAQVNAQSIRDDWTEWCAWDIPRLEETQVFRLLFPESIIAEAVARQESLQLTVQMGVLRLLLGPSDASSEIAVAETHIRVNIEPPTEPSGLMLVEENLRTLTSIQGRSSAVFARLRWDLIPFIDPVVQAYEEHIRPVVSPATSGKVEEDAEESTTSRRDYHFVFSTDNGSIILDSINVQHISATQNLKVSVVGTSRAANTYDECFCILMSADQATTELRALRRDQDRIWRTVLSTPSIYIDFRKLRAKNAAELNIGGTYGTLKINFDQEVLGLLSIVDSVVSDEVSQIRVIQEKFERIGMKAASEQRTRPATKPELYVKGALLAGAFNADIKVLQSLTMNISGETANLRVGPVKGSKASLTVELEVGPVRFAALSKESGLVGQEALFFTPSIGISAEAYFPDDRVDLAVSGVVQEMSVEAAALQNILVVFRRPEVQNTMQAAQESLSDLKRRISDGDHQDGTARAEPPVAEKSAAVTYDVNLTLAGLKVLAKAPVLEADGIEAELVMGVRPVHAIVENKSITTTGTGAMPKIYARVDSLYADLELVSEDKRTACGHIKIGAVVRCTPSTDSSSHLLQDISVSSEMLDVEVSAATASTIVDVVTHIQRKIVDLDLSKEMEQIRRLRQTRRKPSVQATHKVAENVKVAEEGPTAISSAALSVSNLAVNLNRIRFAWVVIDDTLNQDAEQAEDLELTLARVELSVKQQHRARLTIQDLQLQMVPQSHDSFTRSSNSALLPEVVFTVMYDSQAQGARLAFQAIGQILDLRVDSSFIGPLGILIRSGQIAIDKYRDASANWQESSCPQDPARTSPFGNQRFLSILVDADFAGAVLYLQGRDPRSARADAEVKSRRQSSIAGLAAARSTLSTTLRAPGVALKVEYHGETDEVTQSTLSGEVKVEASSNTVYPELVPIILQISDNAKTAMRDIETREQRRGATNTSEQAGQTATSRLMPNENILETNAILGKTRLSFGLRICRQEFGLSCQPIARVNAKVQIEDVYITLNTMDPEHTERFLALSAAFTNFGASVQHVYSRDSTFSFDAESVVFSVMNSKHLGGGPIGVSAVLKFSPMKSSVNARQLQDLLLFQEIWMPQSLREQRESTPASPAAHPEEFMVQRYRQVATATAFPWDAMVSLEDLAVNVDFGQSIGKSSISVHNLWASSTKSSGWKQDLCVGLDKVDMQSVGRMGGFVDLAGLEVRTSIEWPSYDASLSQTPIIQATAGFERLRVKAAFDYQPFAFADVEEFEFLMHNVRDLGTDRLVAVLEGEKVYAFCTSTSPAQAVGLVQAFERLIQEKQTAYKQSVRDLEKQIQRPSIADAYVVRTPYTVPQRSDSESNKLPIKLRTDVQVSLRAISVGAFPSTFLDSQILKLEATDVEMGFLVATAEPKIESNLSMTLGQVHVALASVKRIKMPKTLGEIPAEEVIGNAVASKGGVIARVPRVVASMQTWQAPGAKTIDYIFKSAFEGKIDVGWNYSRISFIRGMWNTHSRSLAARLGKPLPKSAVKITAGPEESDDDNDREKDKDRKNTGTTAANDDQTPKSEQGKITAVINMPTSRYEYRALEPPIVETPQLRDMGEATPPLEWIGLHRERLPNVVHQVVIVALLEVAKEVEDAYERILGAS